MKETVKISPTHVVMNRSTAASRPRSGALAPRAWDEPIIDVMRDCTAIISPTHVGMNRPADPAALVLDVN